MKKKSVAPSIHETAFDCPHCGAYTTQYWFKLYSKEYDGDRKTPFLPKKDFKIDLESDENFDAEHRAELLEWCKNMESGLVFFENFNSSIYVYTQVNNIYLSSCYNCHKKAVWRHDKLLFPPEKTGAAPNPDLPENIVKDFEEARSILDLSSRGAAALLRLAIQKLCIHLNEKGKNIDDDIASLVSKGLNPLIQKSLDIVRVIGNEAVHPGTIDLNDDRDTAVKLFSLINLITEQMISNPKNVNLMYEQLPENKRAAIDVRNDKAKSSNTDK